MKIKHPGYPPRDSFQRANSGSRNKKPVSDETCRTYLSVGSILQSFNSKI